MTDYLLAIEGGGTRSQAALLAPDGQPLQIAEAGDVNTNFVSYALAQTAVQSAARQALAGTGINGAQVSYLVCALVGPRFGAETFGELCPQAAYRYYGEREVVFARAGIYRPHGAALVAATGATAWAVRQDGRHYACGGWGSLLGDEGSAYALGLAGMRAAAQAYERRAALPTHLVEAISQHFQLESGNFQRGLVHLAYQNPLSRAEIASVAAVVTRLAQAGDALAGQLVSQAVQDLAALGRHAARQLFQPDETFDFVLAGGLTNAGEIILAPLRASILTEFPYAQMRIGDEAPAVALGRLALYELGCRVNC